MWLLLGDVTVRTETGIGAVGRISTPGANATVEEIAVSD
jgi:hypothetical protein